MKFRRPGVRAFPHPVPRAAAARGLATILAAFCVAGTALMTGCGQSPGQTGLAYVEAQGIRVSAPLYHLSFDDLPVDSVFGTEVPLNHFGESLLVVGRESEYTARARLGFQLTTKSQRDSLAAGLHLRLTTLPLSTVFAGREWLRTAAAGRDTLKLLVESFSWPDSTGDYSDSLVAFHRRIMTSPVPFSTLDSRFKERDTIRISPSGAYPLDTNLAPDSSQVGALPNLRQRLRTGFGSDSTRKWVIFVEISPLTPSDTGMFHFIAQAAVSSTANLRRYNSGLWLGHYHDDSLQTAGTLLTPYRSGSSSVPAANYEVRHTGASTSTLLHGVSRGLHLRINRDTLIHRIRLKLNAITPGLGNRLIDSGAGAGIDFDRRFFVPYAEMRLPIDTARTRVNGPFALDMGVTSDVDSLGLDTDGFTDYIGIATGDSLRLAVHGGNSGSVAVDTLSITYRRHPADTSLRQALIYWVGDPDVADTFTTVPDDRHRELTLSRRTGWLRSAILSIKPGPAQLLVEVHFNVGAVTEPRHFLDEDGDNITTTATLSKRFWRPGADSLNVRVTRGLQNLLNRVHTPGIGIAPDLFLRSIDRGSYDTATVSDLTYRQVVYPIFGEVAFKRAGNGRLEVGLELYLYPLEARQ